MTAAEGDESGPRGKFLELQTECREKHTEAPAELGDAV